MSYLAMGLPAIAAGFLVSHGSALLATAQIFGAVVAVLSALALVGIRPGRLSAMKLTSTAAVRLSSTRC